jgi:hypothetical protein
MGGESRTRLQILRFLEAGEFGHHFTWIDTIQLALPFFVKCHLYFHIRQHAVSLSV